MNVFWMDGFIYDGRFFILWVTILYLIIIKLNKKMEFNYLKFWNY